MLCCTPLYVTTRIELVQKEYHLERDSHHLGDDCGCTTMLRDWLEFVSQSSEPFAASIRKDVARNCNGSITSPREFCDAISSLYFRARSSIYEFVVKFQRILVDEEELPISYKLLKVENRHIEAFNILLKVTGLPYVQATASGQLLVSACNERFWRSIPEQTSHLKYSLCFTALLRQFLSSASSS
jgi:hypothetical protein